MPKVPHLTAAEAEAALLKAGFDWLRSKGSHRIYVEEWPKGRRPIPCGRDAAPQDDQTSIRSHRGNLD
jgi:predicted RNA binding protein YcfA (HicA-like mRNA interferase family)